MDVYDYNIDIYIDLTCTVSHSVQRRLWTERFILVLPVIC